jgi:hypothetical protein
MHAFVGDTAGLQQVADGAFEGRGVECADTRDTQGVRCRRRKAGLRLALALTLASSLTALLAGRSALSADAVRAVREDW